MNEIEAVRALKKSDKNAFRYLFDLYYDRLVAYINTFTHEPMQSEDIVQQAFVNLWDSREKLRRGESIKSYLYTIARHRYIDSVKNEKRYNKHLEQFNEKALRDRIEEDTEILDKRIEKVKSIIETLPPKCREIVLMNKVEGVKYKDIAEQLNISVKTVEAQMGIAFKKIREGFEKGKLYLFMVSRVFRL